MLRTCHAVEDTTWGQGHSVRGAGSVSGVGVAGILPVQKKPSRAKGLALGCGIAIAYFTLVVVINSLTGNSLFETTPNTESRNVPQQGDGWKTISRADYGQEWPLTISEATLHCENSAVWVVNPANGRRYQVNGFASAYLKNRGHEVYDLQPIWRVNPDIPGARIPVTDLIRDGLRLWRIDCMPVRGVRDLRESTTLDTEAPHCRHLDCRTGPQCPCSCQACW